MKTKYLLILAICIVSFLLPLNVSNAVVSLTMDDTFKFKRGVLDICLDIVNPSLRHYLFASEEETILEGLFLYNKESQEYRHLRKEERLIKEITVLYNALKVRLHGRYRHLFHRNNVIQFGVLADLVIRYVGYELGYRVYIHWRGFQKIGDDPSVYLQTFGYHSKNIAATVNAIANLWLNAWGEIEGSREAGYTFSYMSGRTKDEAIVSSPSTSGGTYLAGTAGEAKEPCPTPYIRLIKTMSSKVAKPGEQVRIRGHRFGTEKGEVMFSPNVRGKVVEWTNTTIIVIVPESATTGPVTVSRPCGSVSNEEYFKVAR